jgi:hypothetical protein
VASEGIRFSAGHFSSNSSNQSRLCAKLPSLLERQSKKVYSSSSQEN